LALSNAYSASTERQTTVGSKVVRDQKRVSQILDPPCDGQGAIEDQDIRFAIRCLERVLDPGEHMLRHVKAGRYEPVSAQSGKRNPDRRIQPHEPNPSARARGNVPKAITLVPPMIDRVEDHEFVAFGEDAADLLVREAISFDPGDGIVSKGRDISGRDIELDEFRRKGSRQGTGQGRLSREWQTDSRYQPRLEYELIHCR
jgi:hypothetical protein